MQRLLGWLRRRPELSAAQQQRLVAWQQRVAGSVSTRRMVVVDVEATGLNLMRDRLISIGAVAVVDGRIAMGDSFYTVLKQPQVSGKDNILIHGITGAQQSAGMAPADALLDFLQYLDDAPLVAFHAAFDETMIKRAMRHALGLVFKPPWLDLAYAMPALYRDLRYSHRVLDDWISQFGIRIETRHHALADAFATAQLLLVARARAQAGRGACDFATLRELDRSQRFNAM